MSLDIVSQKDNPLLKRKHYWVMVDHAGKETPSRHAILPDVCKKLGTKAEVTVIDKMFSERGVAKTRVGVLVYSEKKDVPKEKLLRHERKVKKHLEKNAKAAPAEAPAEEKPAAEEKAEETPAEEKAEEAEAPAEEKEGPEAPADEAPAEETRE